jgi:TIR domain-containing protein/SIR2-like protein
LRLQEAYAVDFDTFLSYDSRDKDLIRQVFEALKVRGIKPWWDEDQLPPGSSFQKELTDAIRNSSTTCVFFGPDRSEPGRWQRPELEFAFQLMREGHHKVIPVLLPGVDPAFRLPEFLPTLSCVAFKDTFDEKTLDKLQWGITGRKPDLVPRTPDRERPEAEDESEDALRDIVEWVRTSQGTVSFIVGSNISSSETDSPPRSSDVALSLLQELKIAGVENTSLLPPIDVAASYYAIRRGDLTLEDRVGVLLESRGPVFSTLHEQLCRYLKSRAAHPSRGRRQQKQLIIYTNFDLNMERALLRNRIPFTRVVQHRSRNKLVLNRYSGIQFEGAEILADERRVNMNNTQDLDEFIRTYGSQTVAADEVRDSDLKEPILYKFRGSHDIQDSCTISSAHLFSYASSLLGGHGPPDFLTSILQDTYVIFLGYGFLDPDFRLIYYTLVQKACTNSDYKKYLVQLAPELEQNDPFRRMESGMWPRIKDAVRRQQIEIVEESGAQFLERLNGKLQ